MDGRELERLKAGVSSKELAVSSEKPHRKLKVWQESIGFVIDLYRVLEGFPKEERFGLVSQLQRAAVSISSNLAEGAARRKQEEVFLEKRLFSGYF